MGNETHINWTDATWNCWHGCHKVSDGCKFCYMFRDKEKYGQEPNKVVRSKTTFNAPLKWTEPRKVFTCSWSDFFIEDADEWRDEAWNIIRKTPHLTYQILTKRPENIEVRLPKDWGYGYENVWLGVSVENQKAADERIPLLLDIPAVVSWLSCEPLLEKVDLTKCGSLFEKVNVLKNHQIAVDHHIFEHRTGISWMVLGGESGNETGKYRYRECEIDWIKDLIWQAQDAKVPVWVKQLGTYLAKRMLLKSRSGGDISEFPLDLQIREFPK